MFVSILSFIRPYQSGSHLALIAVKIWKINSFSSQIVGHSLTPVMLVVIESGAIYSCTLITLLACYLAKSWVQYLVLDSVRFPTFSCRNNALTSRGFSDNTHSSKGGSDHISGHFR